jgi:hypothetical protein
MTAPGPAVLCFPARLACRVLFVRPCSSGLRPFACGVPGNTGLSGEVDGVNGQCPGKILMCEAHARIKRRLPRTRSETVNVDARLLCEVGRVGPNSFRPVLTPVL